MNQKKFPEFVCYFMSYLLPHGSIVVKSMFGGFGIFLQGKMFACIVEKELYFRCNAHSQKKFEQLGCKQFIFESAGRRPIALPYFTLPDEILKNPRELPKWIQEAYLISLQNKKKKKR